MSKVKLSQVADYIGRLQRRSDHLKKRIEENPEKNLSFDKAEKSALDFAIGRLRRDYKNGQANRSETKRGQAVASSEVAT